MRWPRVLLLAAGLLLAVCRADDDYEEGGDSEEDFGGEAVADEEEDTSRSHREDSFQNPSAVFVMEHGWIKDSTQQWLPRGTLLLSSDSGQGFEARLSDAKEFVQLKTELSTMMNEAAEKGTYYTIRMYNPENPKRTLQTAIPAKFLAGHFEDWHDVMEVNLGASGSPLSLSYRVRPSLGLALFEHTQVHIAQSELLEGPRVPSKKPAAASSTGGAAPTVGPDGEEVDNRSFLRKYWWVILIVMLLVSNATDDGSSKGGGGGGKRAAS